MLRIFIEIIKIVLILAVFILACTYFLAPNDIADCALPGVYPNSESKCQKADAIVSISGGNTPARTAEAVRLYQEGWADKIIFSGAAADASSPSNASVMREQAVALGVPRSDILIEQTSQDTRQNANLTRSIIEENNFQKIILTTSGYHQRRASLEFSRALNPINVELTNAPAADRQWDKFWWMNLRGWRLTLSELAGVAAFYARTVLGNG